MVSTYFAPEWFFGYDVALELLFTVILLMVSFYAFKVYRLSEQREHRLFGLAFMFIALSYFVGSLVKFAIISNISRVITNTLSIIGIEAFSITGYFVQAVCFLIGLITIIYVIIKIKNKTIYSLLLILTIVPLVLSSNIVYTSNLLSSIFLLYIVSHYIKTYFKKKQKRTLLMLLAFVFLLFGSVHFIFSALNSIYYVIGHLLVLIAYIFILINLILVFRK